MLLSRFIGGTTKAVLVESAKVSERGLGLGLLAEIGFTGWIWETTDGGSMNLRQGQLMITGLAMSQR